MYIFEVRLYYHFLNGMLHKHLFRSGSYVVSLFARQRAWPNLTEIGILLFLEGSRPAMFSSGTLNDDTPFLAPCVPARSPLTALPAVERNYGKVIMYTMANFSRSIRRELETCMASYHPAQSSSRWRNTKKFEMRPTSLQFAPILQKKSSQGISYE